MWFKRVFSGFLISKALERRPSDCFGLHLYLSLRHPTQSLHARFTPLTEYTGGQSWLLRFLRQATLPCIRQLSQRSPSVPSSKPHSIAGMQPKSQGTNGVTAGDTEIGANVFRNKEKVLVIASRGITFRNRHLMEDLSLLLPHCKKDAKVENAKEERAVMLNEMADLKGCSSSIFFEGRKKKDLYMWIAKTPAGPSAKFLVHAVHTMAELKLTGNHLKGSRPILTFSPSFDRAPHLQLLKELLMQIFSTPKGHRKSKPFFDHVMSFTALDGHVWFRNYQIVVPNPGAKFDKGSLEKLSLVEVGPRLCLNPIKIFGGSFGGATLYENPLYVSPNAVRSQQKKSTAGKYAAKLKAKQRRKVHRRANVVEPDELADMWKEG